MSALIPLHFDRFDVRTVIMNGETWWVLNDVCAVLEIVNPRHAARRLRDWQKDDVAISDVIGRQQMTIVVNEAGIYKLVLNSRKPVAEEFERWLTTEVLPSIRQHGQYPPPPAIEIEALPEPQPLQASHWSSNVQRFLEEADRLAAEHGMSADRFLSPVMSKQNITRLRNYGEGLRSFMKDESKLEAIIGAGFDLQYVLMGRRTMTREERAMIGQFRELDSHQRARVFSRLSSQLPALAGPPMLETEDFSTAMSGQ